MKESRNTTVRYRLDPGRPPRLTREQRQRLDTEKISYADIPQLDAAFFSNAFASWPPAKKQLTIRLDEDVLVWLRSQGKGYQTRINHILRAVMQHQNKDK